MNSSANSLMRWAEILCEHPERASDCHCWQHFGGKEWLVILTKQPQFAKCCPWHFVEEWNCQHGHHNWIRLLSAQPQFADKLPNWAILNDAEVSEILQTQPKLAHYINDVAKRGGKVVALFLKEIPDKKTLCAFEQFGSGDMREFILETDSIADDILARLKWKQIFVEDWVRILSAKPEYAKHVADSQWRSFSARGWSHLLDAQPQFKEQFDQFASDEVKREVALIHQR